HFGDHGKVFIFMAGKTPPSRMIVAYPGLRRTETTGQRQAGQLVMVADIKDDPALQAFTDEVQARVSSANPRTEDQFSFRQGGIGYLAGYRSVKIENGPKWLLGAFAPDS